MLLCIFQNFCNEHVTIVTRKNSGMTFLGSTVVHNHVSCEHGADGVCLDLDEPEVSCYFATWEMCDFGQIINLYRPQFPQLDIGNKEGQYESIHKCIPAFQ